MFVCHGLGSARERFIVRMGMALNQALYDENIKKEGWVERLGYAMLSIPAGAALLKVLLNPGSRSMLDALSSCCRNCPSSGLSLESLHGLQGLRGCQAEFLTGWLTAEFESDSTSTSSSCRPPFQRRTRATPRS